MQGIYAITPDEDNDDLLLNKIIIAIKGGIRIIQYRHSTATHDVCLRQALSIATICKAHHVMLLINNHIDIAKTCSASGVHLGINDTPITTARAQLGNDAIIGATCYNSLERAKVAQKSGANYIAIGAIFPSPTKPNAPQCSLEKLRTIKQKINLPLIAIGGINFENAQSVLATGVDCIAMVSGLFDTQDITANCQKLTQILKKSPHDTL